MATAITMKRYNGSTWEELNPATTIAQVSGLQTALDSKQATLSFDATPTLLSTNPVTSGGVYDAIDNVAQMANGKTSAYVCSYASNADFNSSAAQITITSSFTDINSHTITLSDLQVGDVILITEVDVPDRWVGALTNSSATLYKMETTKVDLTPYALDSGVVHLAGAETITGAKTFSDDVEITGGNSLELWVSTYYHDLHSEYHDSKYQLYVGRHDGTYSPSTAEAYFYLYPHSNGMDIELSTGSVIRIPDDSGTLSMNTTFLVDSSASISGMHTGDVCFEY